MLLENSNQRLDASFSLRRAGYFCHVGEERGARMRAGSGAAGTALVSLLIWALIPFIRAAIPWSNYLSKTPTLNPIEDLSFNMNLGRS